MSIHIKGSVDGGSYRDGREREREKTEGDIKQRQADSWREGGREGGEGREDLRPTALRDRSDMLADK